MSGNTAWVTLATNDTYCLGALVLANSLKRVNTVHQLAVLITPGVSQPMRQQLAKVFNVVKEVDVLDSGDEANLALIARPELGVTFTKLHCWNLTQFSKCVFLDADILVIQNSDELFEREELSAAPDVGWPDCFNSGVFVFVPSKDTFKALIDCALAQGSFDGGDQGLLNIFFKDWPTKDIKKHLPFIYNMVSTATYSYLPAFKLFGSQVKIVHFIGSNKPWLQSGRATTSTLSGFLETWWNIFNSQVSQTLSTEMISNYTFDDVRWQNHSSFTQSPIPVYNHSYEQFRGVNMVQEQPEEEERHQFIDPWEEITLEQVESTTREHCAESSPEAGYTNYLAERNDNCICLNTEESSDLVQKIGEIRLTAEDQNNTEHSINGYCRNQFVPSCVDVSVHALGMRNISEQIPVVSTYNESQSEKQMYNTKQINNFSNDISSNTANFQRQDSHHIPCTSIHSSMPPLSPSQLPSQPVDMHPNNIPQTCFVLQQESTSNDGFYQEAGLAGALAGGERGAIEEIWRRQNWEQGVIDYMGRDSFDNIWKKISESIGTKAAVPATAPVVAAPSTEAGDKSSVAPAAPAETKESPIQQCAKELTDSAVTPPVKVEQLEGVPVAGVQQVADKAATPLEKKDEAPKTEIPKSEPANKEDASSKSEKVDVAEQAKAPPLTVAEVSKEKAQDLPKSDAPTTPTKPVQPSEITPQKEGEQLKTQVPMQPLPAVPLPPPEAKTETPADTKPTQEAKSDVVPTETKGTEEKSSSDKAGKEITEAAVSKQEVSKAETTPPTPTECSKADTAQPVKAISAEEKTDKPETKESVPSDAHKTEEVKTPPVEVKTTQEVPKETAATEKPAKDDSATKEHSSQAAPKETPAGIEKAGVKEDSAPKLPSLPETPKEALSGPKTPVKDDSVPKVPSSPEALTETVAPPTCTPATPTGTPPAPTETQVVSTVTPTPSTPASTEKPAKDDAGSKVPSSPTAPKELPAGTEQPKKDDSAPKEPASSAAPKEAPKKDDSAPKVPTDPAAVSKDVAPASGVPAEVPPPTTTPSGPEAPSEAKPAAESKKSPPTTAPSTPQAPPTEGASAAAPAPVPPKRKGNKEQKSGNGGKQSKSKK